MSLLRWLCANCIGTEVQHRPGRFKRAWGVGALLLSLCSFAQAEPPSRLHSDLRSGQTFELTGTVHPRVATSTDLGATPATLSLNQITLHFQRSSTQDEQLQKLMQAQQTQNSGQFHRWLTPEQFADRFGASKSDIAKLSSWLKEEGFSNLQVARSRTSISASGSAALVQSAFQTSLHQFRGSNGEVRYANTTDPVLPAALRGFVSNISGLNNFHARSHLVKRQNPHFTSSITGNTFLAPGDFATIYDLQPLYTQGLNGSGQKIVIVGETDINLTQVQTFRSNAGLSANNPQVILDGVDPGVVADEQIEAYLDVEWSGAVAPNATILYVNSTDVFESARYAIDNNLAPVLSITYGLCESQQGSTVAMEALFQQANTQGITVLGASGDAGAADCDSPSNSTQTITSATQGLAVDYPASSTFVTGVGGTSFNEGNGTYWAATNGSNQASALSYIPEVVWNDTVAVGSLSASGGGGSILFAKPSWQVGTGVPSDGVRDVPDIALNASITHDQYLVCGSDGTTTINGTRQIQDCTNGFRDVNTNLDAVGGTSAGPPAFAGVVALMNQLYGGAQGNINPRLYSLASTSTDAFHDITAGNNQVPCTQGTPNCPTSGVMGFSAGTGYDQTTGLGSIDGAHLVDEWQPGFSLSASPTSVTLTGANSSATDTITVTTTGGFTGTVTLSCTVSSALANTTCSLPNSVAGSGTASMTLKRGAVARVMPPIRWTPPPAGINYWLLAAAVLLFAVAVLLLKGRRKRVLAPAFAVLGFVMLAACGSGSSSSSTTSTVSSPVTASVTVTATSGTISHTATVSVTED